MKRSDRTPGERQSSEILILPDGKVFVHNLTPAVAKLLTELDPTDTLMLRRAHSASDGAATPNLPK